MQTSGKLFQVLGASTDPAPEATTLFDVYPIVYHHLRGRVANGVSIRVSSRAGCSAHDRACTTLRLAFGQRYQAELRTDRFCSHLPVPDVASEAMPALQALKARGFLAQRICASIGGVGYVEQLLAVLAVLGSSVTELQLRGSLRLPDATAPRGLRDPAVLAAHIASLLPNLRRLTLSTDSMLDTGPPPPLRPPRPPPPLQPEKPPPPPEKPQRQAGPQQGAALDPAQVSGGGVEGRWPLAGQAEAEDSAVSADIAATIAAAVSDGGDGGGGNVEAWLLRLLGPRLHALELQPLRWEVAVDGTVRCEPASSAAGVAGPLWPILRRLRGLRELDLGRQLLPACLFPSQPPLAATSCASGAGAGVASAAGRGRSALDGVCGGGGSAPASGVGGSGVGGSAGSGSGGHAAAGSFGLAAAWPRLARLAAGGITGYGLALPPRGFRQLTLREPQSVALLASVQRATTAAEAAAEAGERTALEAEAGGGLRLAAMADARDGSVSVCGGGAEEQLPLHFSIGQGYGDCGGDAWRSSSSFSSSSFSFASPSSSSPPSCSHPAAPIAATAISAATNVIILRSSDIPASPSSDTDTSDEEREEEEEEEEEDTQELGGAVAAAAPGPLVGAADDGSNRTGSPRSLHPLHVAPPHPLMADAAALLARGGRCAGLVVRMSDSIADGYINPNSINCASAYGGSSNGGSDAAGSSSRSCAGSYWRYGVTAAAGPHAPWLAALAPLAAAGLRRLTLCGFAFEAGELPALAAVLPKLQSLHLDRCPLPASDAARLPAVLPSLTILAVLPPLLSTSAAAAASGSAASAAQLGSAAAGCATTEGDTPWAELRAATGAADPDGAFSPASMGGGCPSFGRQSTATWSSSSSSSSSSSPASASSSEDGRSSGGGGGSGGSGGGCSPALPRARARARLQAGNLALALASARRRTSSSASEGPASQ